MLGHADLKFRQIRAKDYILFKKIEKNSKVHLIVRVHLIVPTPVAILGQNLRFVGVFIFP